MKNNNPSNWTLKQLNEVLATRGVELVKENGYLYFWPLNDTSDKVSNSQFLNNLKCTSIPVCNLHQIDFQSWLAEYDLLAATAKRNCLELGNGDLGNFLDLPQLSEAKITLDVKYGIEFEG